MSSYGLLNDTRALDDNPAFFVIQVAVSSYPGDPLREELAALASQIVAAGDREANAGLIVQAAKKLANALPWTEYCVWDYSLVKEVAVKEFVTWVDGIQNIAWQPDDKEDTTEFVSDDTTCFIATLAILSNHATFRNWLDASVAAQFEGDYFTRATIESLWNRICRNQSDILPQCANAMFTVMPRDKELFHSGKQLRGADWDYLRPVY